MRVVSNLSSKSIGRDDVLFRSLFCALRGSYLFRSTSFHSTKKPLRATKQLTQKIYVDQTERTPHRTDRATFAIARGARVVPPSLSLVALHTGKIDVADTVSAEGRSLRSLPAARGENAAHTQQGGSRAPQRGGRLPLLISTWDWTPEMQMVVPSPVPVCNEESPSGIDPHVCARHCRTLHTHQLCVPVFCSRKKTSTAKSPFCAVGDNRHQKINNSTD